MVSKNYTFKDLSVTFKAHPITGDLIVVKDDKDIVQSITNLLMTDIGERPFQSSLGTRLSRLIFDPLDSATAGLIANEIKNVIERYETRVLLDTIEVSPDYDENGFDVELVVNIIGREEIPVEVQFFLERTR
jgi:phage baseplate assembly protein W